MRGIGLLPLRAGFGMLGLCLAALAAAEEPAVLDTVVVSASREATKLSETPAAIVKVGNKQLDELKPQRIDQVLNTVPGVNMVDLGNEQHTMSIRMPITYSAFYQYLEDGVPIRPLGVFNHNALIELNLAGTGEVEVLRGPASSLYGSNAVGGAVNFLSRAPSRQPEATLGLRGSDQGYYRLDVGASGRSGDVGGRIAYYGARNDSSWRQQNDFQKDSATARVDLGLGDNSILQSTLTYNLLDTDMPGSLSAQEYYNNPANSYHRFTFRRDESTRLTTALETQWNDSRSTVLTLFLRQNEIAQNPSYSISNSIAPGGQGNGRDNVNRYTSIGLDAKWREHFAWADGRLVAGVIYDRSPVEYREDVLTVFRDADSRFRRFTSGGLININTGANCSTASATCQNIVHRRDYDVLVENPSAYAQYEWAPMEHLRLVVGGRLDLVSYDFTNNIYDASRPGLGAPSESRDFSHFSPRVGAVYAFSEQWQLYSNISEGFTPPEVSALYGALTVPDLRESTYRNYDLGLRYAFADRKGQLEATIYRLDGSDEVVSYNPCVPSCGVASSVPVNSGNTRHQGLELGLNYVLAPEWETRLGATLAEHEFVDYRTSPTQVFDGKDMPMAPNVVANAELAWKPGKSWRLALEAQHLSRYWMDEANAVEYPGYTLWNLRAQYRQATWEWYAQGLNLGDKRYATTAQVTFGSRNYTPGDPRTVLLGVNYRFQ